MVCGAVGDQSSGSGWVLQLSSLWSSPHAAGQSHTLPCSSMAPTETVLELLQSGSFPWAAALHELQHHWVLPTGSLFQEPAASDPSSTPAPVWAPLCAGPRVLPGACPRTTWPPSGALLLRCWGSPRAVARSLLPLDSSTGHNPSGWSSGLPHVAVLPCRVPAQAHGGGCYQVFQAQH